MIRGDKFIGFLIGLMLHFCPGILWAQTAGGDVSRQYFDAAGDNAALYRGKALTTTFQSSEWLSHPYWEDEEFRVGEVCFSGVVYPYVKLRYDVYNHLLEVQTPQRGFVVLPDQDKVDYFTMDGFRFVRYNDVFVREDYHGRTVSLHRQRTKHRMTNLIRDGYSYKRLETDDAFMLHRADGNYEVSNLRSLSSLYPEYRKQLKNFAQTQKLKFKGDERGRSLARLTEYLDGLLPVSQEERVVSDTITRVVEVPQSILTEDIETKVPAYEVFREGSTAVRQRAEIERSEVTAGIESLKPMTEDKFLDEVEVTAFRSNVGVVQMGVEKFRPSQLRNVPMALGEADIMKMVETLPVVKTMGEASSGFNVRGGAADQNLILLSGNTLYNPMHMFGLFSAFNTDAINDVELFKSSIPAQYGGRISSVMNMTGKQASKQEWHGSLSAGLLTSKAHLEIPLVKNHLSLLLAGRTTYSDWLMKKIPEKSEYHDGKAGFYDLNGTLAWTVNERHFVNVYAYGSHDRFSFTEYDKYGYSNINGSAEWKAYWSDRLQSTISSGMDHYDYLNDEKEVPTTAARLSFQLQQQFLRGLFTLKANERNEMKFGWNALRYNLRPGKYEPIGMISNIALRELERDKALEGALFVEDEWEIVKKWKLNGGLRYSIFQSMREGMKKMYQAPEVRFSTSYMLTEDQSLKVGFNTMNQFIHKVSNTVIMSPTDTWTLSNSRIKPQHGWQIGAGYNMRTENRQLELTAEIYYKRMSNYLTYRSAAQLIMNEHLEDDVFGAQGQAYGLEVQLKKPVGKLNGWISYSYARTFLRQKDDSALPVNGGDWYNADCDRPHELNVVANYRFTRRYSTSLNLDYATGRPTTVPAGRYFDTKLRSWLPYYTERNGYRLPDNFRIDLSFNIEPGHHQTAKTRSWFSFGVYNVLGRHNVYSVYYDVYNGMIRGYKLSIFGVPIPFISYNLKF